MLVWERWPSAKLVPITSTGAAVKGEIEAITPDAGYAALLPENLSNALGNQVIKLPPGVSALGYGDTSEVTSTADLNELGAIVSPGDDSTIADFKVRGISTTKFQAPFGWNVEAGTPQTPATRWLLYRMAGISDTDGWFSNFTSPPTSPIAGRIARTVLNTKYDCAMFLGTGADYCGEIVLDSNFWWAQGPSIVAAIPEFGDPNNIARGMVLTAFNVKLIGGGTYKAGGANNTGTPINTAIHVDNGNGFALAEVLGNPTLYAYGQNATPVLRDNTGGAVEIGLYGTGTARVSERSVCYPALAAGVTQVASGAGYTDSGVSYRGSR